MHVFRNQHDSSRTDRPSLTTPQISGGLRSRQLRRRYGTELLGALLFIAAIVAFNSYTHSASSQGAKSQSSTSRSNVISTQAAPNDGQAKAPASSSNTTISQEDSTMPHSANNNDVDAHVTVNGVDVPVPVNGTSQQTVVGNGSPTSVTISSGQTSTGKSSNTNHISTHLNVSTTTRSNDSTTESWSSTP